MTTTTAVSVAEARRIDARIRAKVIAAVADIDAIRADVLEELQIARDDGVAEALGWSWPAYLADVLAGAAILGDRGHRREIVAWLADEGMSTRAIAPIVGVDQATVVRDLASGDASASPDEISIGSLVSPDDEMYDVDESPAIDPALDDEPKPITGLDGKIYPPRPSAPLRLVETEEQRAARLAADEQREREEGRQRANNYVAEAVRMLARGGAAEIERFVVDIWPAHAEHVPDGMRITAARLDDASDFLTALRKVI